MKHLLTLLLSAPLIGWANPASEELDNEKEVTNWMKGILELPQTLVVRVNETTKETQVVHLNQPVGSDPKQIEEISKLKFTHIDANQRYEKTAFGELDHDKSRENWFFGFTYSPSYYPYYGYGGGYGYGYGYPYYSSYAYAPYPYYSYCGYPYSYYPYSYYNNYYGWNYYYYRPYRLIINL